MPDLDRIEVSNLEEIEGLNQRGGRMLSMLDLLQADTLSPEMAGYLLFAMRHGASILTGARPGGAGKTALLGAILNLRPPSERLVTIGRRDVLRSSPAKPACFLAHEIGAGPYYGYIWGEEVSAFLGRTEEGYRVATTLHADDAEDARGELRALGVPDVALSRVTVMAFIRAERHSWKTQHTVQGIYERTGHEGHRLLFRPEGARFVQEEASSLADDDRAEEEFRDCCALFERLSCRPELSSVW